MRLYDNEHSDDCGYFFNSNTNLSASDVLLRYMSMTKLLILATSAIAMFSFSASRSLEIYKQKVSEKDELLQQVSVTATSSSWKKTLLSSINETGGILYAVFFFMTVSTSLVDAEDEFGIPTQPRYIDIINLVLLSIGAVLVEYNFIFQL